MKAWIVPVFLVAYGLLVLGCSDDGGPECLTSADCEGAAICLDGKCQTLGCQGNCADAPYHIILDTYAGMESSYSLDVQCQ